MKVLVCDEPGQFSFTDRPIPEPASGNALLKVLRIGVCGTDLHAFEGTQPYFNYPRILGHELAAEIIAINAVSDLAIGTVVTVIPYINCEICLACRSGKPNCCSNIAVLGVHTDGGMREYIEVPARLLLPADGLAVDELALVEPLAIGAHAIRRAAVQPNEFVLVIGAGPIGLGCMQFAALAGAKVIALDINQQRLDLCKEKLNVNYTINASDGEVSGALSKITGGDMPSVVIDATGNQKSINSAFQYLAHGGRYVLVGLQSGEISFSHPEFHKREATLMSSRNATRQDFDQVIAAIKNKLIDPSHFITHRINFGDVINEFQALNKPASKVIKAIIEL